MNPLQRLALTPLILVLSFAACKKEAATTTESTAASPADPASSGIAVLSGQGQVPAPVAAKNPGTAGPATANAPLDLADMERPLDARGIPATDLEMLNYALEAYRMKAGTGTAPASGKKPTGPAEEAEAAAAAYTPAAINDIADLVKAGVIKSIPPAPAGKKYQYDRKAGQIMLVDQ